MKRYGLSVSKVSELLPSSESMAETHDLDLGQVPVVCDVGEKLESRIKSFEKTIAAQNARIDSKVSELLDFVRSVVRGSDDSIGTGSNDSRTLMVKQNQKINQIEVVAENPFVALLRLREINGIVEYHEKFEMLRSMTSLSEEYMVKPFLDGLKMDTQAYVRRFQPQSIHQCLILGKMYEKAHHKLSTSELRTAAATENYEVNSLGKEVNCLSQDEQSLEDIDSVLDTGCVHQMALIPTSQIEFFENKVPNSTLEPSHRDRVERMEIVLLKKERSQSCEVLLVDDICCDMRSDVLIPPTVKQVYVLDVELVKESIHKSHDADIELIANNLFDQVLLRVDTKRKQAKYLKNWKFKFKIKKLTGTRPQIEKPKLLESMITWITWQHWRMENLLMRKGLSGLSLCTRVWEPGGILTKLDKWNGSETCHVDGWMMRVIQRRVGDGITLPNSGELVGSQDQWNGQNNFKSCDYILKLATGHDLILIFRRISSMTWESQAMFRDDGLVQVVTKECSSILYAAMSDDSVELLMEFLLSQSCHVDMGLENLFWEGSQRELDTFKVNMSLDKSSRTTILEEQQSEIAHVLFTVVRAWVLVVDNVSIDEVAYEPLVQQKRVFLQIQDDVSVEVAADCCRVRSGPCCLCHTTCGDLMVCDDFSSNTSVVVLLGHNEDQVQVSYVEKEDGFQKNAANFDKQNEHHGFEEMPWRDRLLEHMTAGKKLLLIRVKKKEMSKSWRFKYRFRDIGRYEVSSLNLEDKVFEKGRI